MCGCQLLTDAGLAAVMTRLAPSLHSLNARGAGRGDRAARATNPNPSLTQPNPGPEKRLTLSLTLTLAPAAAPRAPWPAGGALRRLNASCTPLSGRGLAASPGRRHSPNPTRT